MPLTHLMLAQMDAPPAELGSWLSVAGWLIILIGGALGIAVAIKTLREKKTEIPTPITVQEHQSYVTTVSHDKDIKEIKDELKRHGARRSEIYAKQEEQGAQLAALVSKTDMMNAQQIRQEAKIDILLSRTPTK